MPTTDKSKGHESIISRAWWWWWWHKPRRISETRRHDRQHWQAANCFSRWPLRVYYTQMTYVVSRSNLRTDGQRLTADTIILTSLTHSLKTLRTITMFLNKQQNNITAATRRPKWLGCDCRRRHIDLTRRWTTTAVTRYARSDKREASFGRMSCARRIKAVRLLANNVYYVHSTLNYPKCLMIFCVHDTKLSRITKFAIFSDKIRTACISIWFAIPWEDIVVRIAPPTKHSFFHFMRMVATELVLLDYICIHFTQAFADIFVAGDETVWMTRSNETESAAGKYRKRGGFIVYLIMSDVRRGQMR